jgi:outer membrane lipoprotein-sorting protein
MKKYKYYLSLLLISSIAVISTACAGNAENPEATQNVPEENTNTTISAEELLARGMSEDGFSYEYVLTMPDGTKTTNKMWVKGGNMRSEMDNPYGGEPILSIINTQENSIYVYQPEINQAIVMPIEDSEIDITSPKDYLSDSNPENMMYSSKETFDGKECLVYETNYAGGKGKIWIWEEYGMPLRVETESGDDKIVAEFINFEIGNVDDSVFLLPEGVKITDMSSFAQ